MSKQSGFDGAHVQPLNSLRDGIYKELECRHGVRSDQLRAYMHYLPSFWMAHIHFAAITCRNLVSSTSVGKAILLDDIIDALLRDRSHFRRSSLTYMVGERDPLHALLVEAGALPPLPPLPPTAA